jgi:hypothetical protein
VKRALGFALTYLAGAGCSALAFAVVAGREPYQLPQVVVEHATSPSGAQAAVVLEAAHHRTGFDLLGGDRRLFLALRRADTTCILTRELSEGFGSYQGGVGALTWNGEHSVVLERWVSDREANVTFNTDDWTWSDQP